MPRHPLNFDPECWEIKIDGVEFARIDHVRIPLELRRSKCEEIELDVCFEEKSCQDH